MLTTSVVATSQIALSIARKTDAKVQRTGASKSLVLARNHRRSATSKAVSASLSSASPQNAGPFNAINPVLNWATKLVHDAFSLIQRLFHLLQRIHIATATIKQESEKRKALAAAASLPAKAVVPTFVNPLENLAFGAASQLTQTLNDASGTLDAKCKALQSTTSAAMNQLFKSSESSAQTLNKYNGNNWHAAQKIWTSASANNADEVLEHEDQLRAQVFAQVMAELSKKNDSGSCGGYAAAS